MFGSSPDQAAKTLEDKLVLPIESFVVERYVASAKRNDIRNPQSHGDKATRNTEEGVNNIVWLRLVETARKRISFPRIGQKVFLTLVVDIPVLADIQKVNVDV